jgi:hypothetical protein
VRLYPAQVYYLVDRGDAKLELKDRAGAIADYRKSIELYRQQGSTSDVERLTEKVHTVLFSNMQYVISSERGERGKIVLHNSGKCCKLVG